MPTVALARHGKSSWDDPSVKDHDRPLDVRGHHNATKMATRLCRLGFQPDLIVTSSAVRAFITAEVMSGVMCYRAQDIRVMPGLYTANLRDARQILEAVKDDPDQVLVVGHNPTMTELLNELTGSDLLEMPTCGVGIVRFDGRWSDLSEGCGELVAYEYPSKASDL